MDSETRLALLLGETGSRSSSILARSTQERH